MEVVACFWLESIGIATERSRVPTLYGEPFALADTTGKLLCVSPETYLYGIRSGMSIQAARSMCEGLTVLPYQRDTYMIAAEAIWNLVAVETSVVEPLSPEIVYALFDGRDIVERIKTIAQAIASTVMIDVKVGIGKSKLVAEHAAKQDRKSAVIAVRLGMEPAAVAGLSLRSIPRLDSKLLDKLEKLSIRTLGDIAKIPLDELRRKFKTIGQLLYQLANGDDGSRVLPLWPKATIEVSLSFDEGQNHTESILIGLKQLADKIAGELLRRELSRESYCRTLLLLLTLENGNCLDDKERLPSPTRLGYDLYLASKRLLQRMISRVDHPITGLELIASDLDAGSQAQLTFTEMDEAAAKREQHNHLDSTLERLWRRFGPRAVITAALLSQAKRIHLWTHSLAKLRSEPVRVYTDHEGAPVRYTRTKRRLGRNDIDTYDVAEIIDHWRTTDWKWGDLIEKECWRVEATPEGIHELHRFGVEWMLEAEAD